jgi:hypothetical protein
MARNHCACRREVFSPFPSAAGSDLCRFITSRLVGLFAAAIIGSSTVPAQEHKAWGLTLNISVCNIGATW